MEMNLMLPPGEFIRESLELHLFFGRIMKEHAIFLEAGFVPKDAALAQQAEMFKRDFAVLLQEAICLANGVVSQEALLSGEAVTDKTLRAEQITEQLSGIGIDSQLTMEELNLSPDGGSMVPQLEEQVAALNQKYIECVKALVQFKTDVVEGMLQCRLFTFNFPLLIIHIRREALFYLQKLERLQRRIVVNLLQDALEEEQFWNRQMAEHAQFISHLLDPTETDLILKANGFAGQYFHLDNIVQGKVEGTKTLGQITNETINTTRAFRDFKAAGTEGLLLCQIKSIVIPLLADHVLREANHYLRVLNKSKRDLHF